MTWDTIVVGSGNGACGFLSHYLENCPEDERVLVLEEGCGFFETSDVGHQNNWTQSYAEGRVFKLHEALTTDGLPIISGRACAQGGGGSINYTMIHESDEWLSQNLGHSEDYWAGLKAELNAKFQRIDPRTQEATPVTQHIVDVVTNDAGFKENADVTEGVPNFRSVPAGEGLLHRFPTQFNFFGQRTHSGVSIVNWADKRLTLRIRCRVVGFDFDETPRDSHSRCLSVTVRSLVTGNHETLFLDQDKGRVVFCAGGNTPRLLFPHRDVVGAGSIGKHVSDHILLPLGIYVVEDTPVFGKDVYAPAFATTKWVPDSNHPGAVPTDCCFDFFCGSFEKLWYMISHLYLAILFPNWAKKLLIKNPWMFMVAKSVVRIFVLIVNHVIHGLRACANFFLRRALSSGDIYLITAIVKFNPRYNGRYVSNGSKIELEFFSEDQHGFNQDKEVAKTMIKSQMAWLEKLGAKPHWIVRLVYRIFSHIPYEEWQVDRYVEVYSKKFLLSEQHLSGGCLLGAAASKGLPDGHTVSDTGKIHGSANLYVADLSSVPLPRISPQMTAYLVGYHIAKQLTMKQG